MLLGAYAHPQKKKIQICTFEYSLASFRYFVSSELLSMLYLCFDKYLSVARPMSNEVMSNADSRAALLCGLIYHVELLRVMAAGSKIFVPQNITQTMLVQRG